jgi:hypothetical protein
MIIINNKNKGSLLIDVILALSIGLIFITTITASSFSAQTIFQKAKEKEKLIKDYYSLEPAARLYGNNFIEKNYINISSSTSFVGVESVQNLDFNQNNNSLFVPIESDVICSVDFAKNHVVGSYGYLDSNDLQTDPSLFSSTSIKITPIHLPVDPLLPLTDLEIRNDIAYISADSAKQTDPDIFIFDISDPNNVKQISSLNTGPGLASFILVGKRIYAVAPSTIAQLHIVRLDGLNKPVLENYYKLTLPYATATPALGSAIAYEDNKIFLGTEKWDGEELNIIDISDFNLPIKINGLEINSKINDILINQKTAYISSANQNQLSIIDINDFTKPMSGQIFSPSGWQRQDGKVGSYFEQQLYFGRTSGGFDLPNEHEVFSWASTSINTFQDHNSMNVSGGVYGIVGDRSAIYLATRQLNKEFQIFNKDLSVSLASYSLPIAPQTMTCYGDSIYLLANRAPFIYKIVFEQ